MSPIRYRAWRFEVPGFHSREVFTGFSNSATGGVAMVEDAASVRQSVLLLLVTRTGERIMRPDYGTDLHKLVFSPNDDTTAGLAIHYVRRALTRWEPRIEILRIDAGRNPHEDSFLDVVLGYKVRATQRAETLTFSLNLQGESA